MYTAEKIALSPLPVMYHLPLTDWANLGQVSYEQLHTSVTETRTSVYRSKREEVGKMSMRSERSIILTILDRAFYEQFAPVRDRKQTPPPNPSKPGTEGGEKCQCEVRVRTFSGAVEEIPRQNTIITSGYQFRRV